MIKEYKNPILITLFVLVIWDALRIYIGITSSFFQFVILIPLIIRAISESMKLGLVKSIFSKPQKFWFLWILYSVLNIIFITGFHHPQNQSLLVFIFSLFITLLFVSFIVTAKNEIVMLNTLIWAFFIRMLLTYVFDGMAISGTDITSRLGTSLNSNTIANGALFCLVLILFKKNQSEKMTKIYYLIAAVSILTMFLAASKKVIISLGILSLGYVLINRRKSVVLNLLKFVLASGFIIIVAFLVINNTSVGKRIIDSYERSVNAEDEEGLFDKRAVYYIDGWELFKKNPINGIGLTNFSHVNRSSHVLHTEYMVQLTEGGILGTLLFVLYNVFIMRKLFLFRTLGGYYKKRSEYHILSMLIMFFLFFGAYIYNYYMMWVLIALSVRFIKKTKYISKV